MKDWVILISDKVASLNMPKVKNDLDIYYSVGNANTQRQENELSEIIDKWNSSGWKFISISTEILDPKNQVFKSLSLLGKEIVINTEDICDISQVSFFVINSSNNYLLRENTLFTKISGFFCNISSPKRCYNLH